MHASQGVGGFLFALKGVTSLHSLLPPARCKLAAVAGFKSQLQSSPAVAYALDLDLPIVTNDCAPLW